MEHVYIMTSENLNKPYYVILTGSKNNAGDYLIKYKAKKLFSAIRPDREVVDINAWEVFEDSTLSLVNNSQSLILLGGPSLQCHMYTGIYQLTPNLDDIKVPIVTMGIGWKSISGNWEDTYNYPLSDKTLILLKKINENSIPSSVRDFHTLNTLQFKGLDNVLMTGCPAYYDLDFIDSEVPKVQEIKKVAFSLGVSFIKSRTMEKQMKFQILELRKYFVDKIFEVVFHHSLDSKVFLKTHGAKIKHNKVHNDFLDWLKTNEIDYVDISGSAENLINYYKAVNLHIGYRVHAHIFMNSISKPSVMIAEDGRGKATEKVIGGMVVHGIQSYKMGFLSRVLGKIFKNYDRYKPNHNTIIEVKNHIKYERLTSGYSVKKCRKNINNNFKVMEHFLHRLP